ncbi:MAG: OmpA family protein [Vibrio sp.]|uniref:OmpA family protein n=1 Tax=Vibrio TaxID=662 RepID=UPI0023F7687E|nr:OmpA family protein [Vibrio sp. VCS]
MSLSKDKIYLLSLLPTVFISPTLLAEDVNPFSFRLKGGYQWAMDDKYTGSMPNDNIWGGELGWQFSPGWSFELGYQSHEQLIANNSSINIKTQLFESAIRNDWYLKNNFSLYSRLGLVYWDLDKEQSALPKMRADGFSPFGELGISYHLIENLSLSAGYQYINSIGDSSVGKYDSQSILIGLRYHFGGEGKSTTEYVLSHSDDDAYDIETLPILFTQPSIIDEIFFDYNSSELNEFIDLTEISSLLNSYEQARVVIVGHSDSIGSSKNNQIVSERRAEAVENKLLKLGVNPIQIKTFGEGEHKPLYDNKTVEGRSKNRRVEITIQSFDYYK